MDKSIRTQLRLDKELHEKVRELSHEKRQSRNQFMVESIKDKVEKEAANRKEGAHGERIYPNKNRPRSACMD